MPSNLTDLFVRNAKSRNAAYKLSEAHGLYPLVSKAAGKHWRLGYRHANARRTLTIGPYPLVSLSEARDARDEARKLLRRGVDPLDQQRQVKSLEELAAASTFSVIADEILARMEKERRATATLTKTCWLLDFARPNLGSLPISEIAASQILTVLRKVEDRGRYETANAYAAGSAACSAMP